MGADKDIVDILSALEAQEGICGQSDVRRLAFRDARAEIMRLRGEVSALLEDPDEAELAYRCGDPDSDAIAPAEAKGDGWEENVRYLLDSYPGSIRVRPGAGPEELIGSLSVTFIKLRDLAMKAPQPADGEAVAPFSHVCRFSDDSPWELTVHGKKHCEKCVPVYLHPPAPVQAAPQEGGNPLAEVHEYMNQRVAHDVAAFRHAANPSACELGDGSDDWDWRIGWAIAYSGVGTLYTEDGELQDNRVQPFIDWKRDSAAEIRRKIVKRSNDRAALQHRGDSRGGEG